MPKLSIIVPVYNTEPYLAQCLDSITSQTFPDWEMIIVDDCSTDNSRQIIEKYVQKDERIKAFFHPENKGVSAARNTGLEAASGEFVAFVDSDDWLEPEMYARLLECQAETGADIIECGVKRAATDGPGSQVAATAPAQFDLKKTGLDKYLWRIYQRKATTEIFNKIFRLALIKKNNLRFRGSQTTPEENLLFNYGEDVLFYLCLLSDAGLIAVRPEAYYNYRYRPQSLSHRRVADLLNRTVAIFDRYKRTAGDDLKKAPTALSLLAVMRAKYVISQALTDKEHPIRSGVEAFRQIARTGDINNYLKTALFDRRTDFKDRLLLALFYLRLYHLAALLFYLFTITKL